MAADYVIESGGTKLGKLGGKAPPTGKPCAAEQSPWFRIENGQPREHWATRDDLIAMLQWASSNAPALRSS